MKILIRLDFSTFEIAPPFSCGGSTEPVVCTAADGPRVGDCISDTFTVTTPGTHSTPGTPGTLGTPGTPGTHSTPGTPGTPGTSGTSGTPDTPGASDT